MSNQQSGPPATRLWQSGTADGRYVPHGRTPTRRHSAAPLEHLQFLLIRITIVGMGRKIHGHDVPEEQIDHWVDEAEAGYDPAWLGKRMGRPARAVRAAKVVPVRLTEGEIDAVMVRAEREHFNRSEEIRQALAQWAATS